MYNMCERVSKIRFSNGGAKKFKVSADSYDQDERRNIRQRDEGEERGARERERDM